MLSSTTSSLLLPFVPPVNHNLPRQNIEIAFQSIMASVNEPCIQRLNKLRVHMQVALGALCILPHEWCVRSGMYEYVSAVRYSLPPLCG